MDLSPDEELALHQVANCECAGMSPRIRNHVHAVAAHLLTRHNETLKAALDQVRGDSHRSNDAEAVRDGLTAALEDLLDCLVARRDTLSAEGLFAVAEENDVTIDAVRAILANPTAASHA